jgi:hypothetical protein
MGDNNGFWTDPKIYISILAIIISIVSLIFTISNQVDQNSKWDKLNQPNLILKEVKFLNWNEVTKDDALKTEWGYKPVLYQKTGSFNHYVLPYFISIYKKDSNQRVSNANISFTINQIVAELNKLKIKSEDVILYRLFRNVMVIENIGKTNAKKIFSTVKAKMDNQWVDAFTANTKIELSTNQTSSISFDIELPLFKDIPQELDFIIYLEWENTNNKKEKKSIAVKWTSQDNYWSYGSLEQ